METEIVDDIKRIASPNSALWLAPDFKSRVAAAAYALSLSNIQGFGSNIDYDEASRWLILSAELGFMKSQEQIYRLLCSMGSTHLGPQRPRRRWRPCPHRGARPVTALAAASAAAPPNADSSQEPTLIGEVTLATRSMFRNRSGRPRSATSAAPDSPIAPTAHTFDARASSLRPVACANPASTDEAPRSPPKNR